MKVKKLWFLYGSITLLFFLCFVGSPRFGWYMRDSYSGSWLRYAGTKQEGTAKTIHYKSRYAEVSVTEEKGTQGYRVDYYDKRQEGQAADSWEIKNLTELRQMSALGMPTSVYLIGEDLYRQDKQERGLVLYLIVLLLGAASLFAVWCGVQGIQQNRRLKRDIGMLLCAMLLVLYAGSCLRITHWGGLDVFFL